MAASDWISFWDSKHSIYVNERHHRAHYERIAADLRRYLPAGGTVLDYGCGEALAADRVAEPVAQLILCEAAPTVRATLTSRFAGNAKIAVRTPDEIAAMPAQSFDLILMHSVAQYLSADEFDAMARNFRRLLKPGGLFILGDIIPPKTSAIADAMSLLKFGASEGFLLAAFAGLVRTVFSSYVRMRRQYGLSRYTEAGIIDRLTAAGFNASRADQNIGHNPERMTFLARVS